MTQTLRVDLQDNITMRAQQAIWDAAKRGCKPLKWKLGTGVWDRLRRDLDPRMEFATLFGLPFEVDKQAPPTLLELDEF